MVLTGDIGGTKTVLSIINLDMGIHAPVAEKSYPSKNYPNLEAVVRDFLGETKTTVTKAVFGVAGPVVNGNSQITNLPWQLSEESLKISLGLDRVYLINDLVAISYGVLKLDGPDLINLQSGEKQAGGSIAVIAPGTGLGEAYLTYNENQYRAYPSEGGHVDFAPTQLLEFGLLRYLQERFGHVSYERICSGSGLPNIYFYLREMGYASEPVWLSKQLEGATDVTPIIVNAAFQTDEPCELARTTIQTFVSVLGAETGNLALKVLATGGIYIAGGMPTRILPALTDGTFLQAFLKKGRFSNILSKIPVNIVTNPKVALMGAFHYLTEVAPSSS